MADSYDDQWNYRGIRCEIQLLPLRDEPGYSGSGKVFFSEGKEMRAVEMPIAETYATREEAIESIKAKQILYIDEHLGGL